MKKFTIRKRKKDKINLKESRSCFICHQVFHFNEYKNIYLYLSSIKNPVENFFNTLNNKGEFNFNADINIPKIWRNSKNKVFCPSCLIDFKHAYNLKRKCIKCGKEITFLECCWSSFNKSYSKEELMIYWINPVLQFFCCYCYKHQERKL